MMRLTSTLSSRWDSSDYPKNYGTAPNPAGETNFRENQQKSAGAVSLSGDTVAGRFDCSLDCLEHAERLPIDH